MNHIVDHAVAVLHKLVGHEGCIKGLAFDPTGCFLFSQSDSPALTMYRKDSSGWKFYRRITEPMADSAPNACYFERGSWAPDGSLYALPDASVSGLPAVALLSRSDEFGVQTNLIGHSSPVEVCVSPTLFKCSHAHITSASTQSCER